MMLHSHPLLSPFSPLPPLSPSLTHPSPSSLLSPPTSHHLHLLRLPFLRATGPHTSSLAELPSQEPAINNITNQEPMTQGEGPIELPPSSYPSSSTIFAVDDNPSPLQVATSVLLTGAISLFLFRSLRRRARRAKELRVRSTGVKKSKDLKEEALESLKTMGVASVEPGAPPSPVQAMLGGIAAGVIAVILYRFTTTIEASLNRQAISDNFSVRQITITVRTIINGLCYLATFVFGINSVGLLLYSIQLAFSSFMESPSNDSKSSQEDNVQSNMTNDPVKSSTYNADSRSSNMQENSDDS